MKNFLPSLLLCGACLLPLGLAGCGNNSSSLSPQDQAHFGKPGDPPPAAFYQAMKKQGSGPPAGVQSAAPPKGP